MADESALIDLLYDWKTTIASGNQTQIGVVVEQGTGRNLAMKLVIEGKEETKAAKAALKAEAAIAKQFEHPSIIRFETFSSSRDATYMLMEFFQAANVKAQLKSELASLHSRARPLLEGVCLALSYLHEKGWVHLDLKPENVLLNRAGEVKLIDFSLATRFSQGITKMLGIGGKKTIQGTRTYIAPETIMRRPSSPQTDIYSLGVMFFEILTGKTPFQGFTPDDLLQKHLVTPPPLPSYINPNLTPEVDQLLLSMLNKKPKERPESVNDIYMALRGIKLFQQDVMQLQAEREEQVAAEKLNALAKLDSRTDHERSELLRSNPQLAEQFEADRIARAERRRPKRRIPEKGAVQRPEAAPAPTLAPSVPAMAAMPQPMMPPLMPPMMMPQPMMPQPMVMPQPMMMPQPIMPQPMMPQPAMMPQPGMPPGYPPAGYPGALPSPQVLPGYPQQPPGIMPQPISMPVQMPTAAPRVATAPAPQPAAPVSPPKSSPTSPTPPSSPAAPPQDLDFMTELPNVL